MGCTSSAGNIVADYRLEEPVDGLLVEDDPEEDVSIARTIEEFQFEHAVLPPA